MGTGVSESIMSGERECYLCGNPNVHKHHIYGGTGRRNIADREGCWVYLCPAHHNMSKHGVHFDKALDDRLKQECQIVWMLNNDCGEREFAALFGRSYL